MAFEQAELRGVGEKRLGLHTFEAEVAGEGGNRLCGIEHQLAAGVPVIKIHAAKRCVQHAVAEGKTKRARPELEMRYARLAHIEIDVGVEGGGWGGRVRRGSDRRRFRRSGLRNFGRWRLWGYVRLLRARFRALVSVRLAEPVLRDLRALLRRRRLTRRYAFGLRGRAFLCRFPLAAR